MYVLTWRTFLVYNIMFDFRFVSKAESLATVKSCVCVCVRVRVSMCVSVCVRVLWSQAENGTTYGFLTLWNMGL